MKSLFLSVNPIAATTILLTSTLQCSDAIIKEYLTNRQIIFRLLESAFLQPYRLNFLIQIV